MNSGTLFTGTMGFTSITPGERLTLATGAMPRMRSN
jgi:hypothetical protein